ISETIRASRGGCGWAERDVAYTLAAPRSRNSSTRARPKPRLPPVTRATAPLIGVPLSKPVLAMMGFLAFGLGVSSPPVAVQPRARSCVDVLEAYLAAGDELVVHRVAAGTPTALA